jgi:hypothetical protein
MHYWPRCVSAVRSGALETRISPAYGEYISRIKKIAPETERAETNKLTTTVALRGANRPKLMKRMVSQKISTISNGAETELTDCSASNQRVCPRPTRILNAWA